MTRMRKNASCLRMIRGSSRGQLGIRTGGIEKVNRGGNAGDSTRCDFLLQHHLLRFGDVGEGEEAVVRFKAQAVKGAATNLARPPSNGRGHMSGNATYRDLTLVPRSPVTAALTPETPWNSASYTEHITKIKRFVAAQD